MLSETEYETKASAELDVLIRALDALEDENIDCELENDIITIEIGDDKTYVVNSHRAARQIWMAAERNAWHFDWQEDQNAWIALKTGEELWETVRKMLAQSTDREDLNSRLVRPTEL
jgi:CyaY protein